jgi:hypothetical protein
MAIGIIRRQLNLMSSLSVQEARAAVLDRVVRELDNACEPSTWTEAHNLVVTQSRGRSYWRIAEIATSSAFGSDFAVTCALFVANLLIGIALLCGCAHGELLGLALPVGTDSRSTGRLKTSQIREVADRNRAKADTISENRGYPETSLAPAAHLQKPPAV